MDGRLKAKVKALTMELAHEEQARLRGAGTMIELEELACEIGDEFTSQLMSLEMADRPSRRGPLPRTGLLLSRLSAVFFSRYPEAWASQRARR